MTVQPYEAATGTIAVGIVCLGNDAFRAMTPEEKTLLVCAGHIANELNVLNKFLVWSIRPSRGIDASVSGMQAMMVAKLTAGKLNEANTLLNNVFVRDLADGKAIQLNEDTRASIKAVRKYFSRKNLISKVRNTLSFHYDRVALHVAAQSVLDLKGSVVVAGTTCGNTYHVGAELAANKALLEAVNHRDYEAALRAFLDEVQVVQGMMLKFLDGVCHALLIKYAPGMQGVAYTEDVHAPGNMEQIKVPFFTSP